jgi:type IV secretion system protein TrbL
MRLVPNGFARLAKFVTAGVTTGDRQSNPQSVMKMAATFFLMLFLISSTIAIGDPTPAPPSPPVAAPAVTTPMTSLDGLLKVGAAIESGLNAVAGNCTDAGAACSDGSGRRSSLMKIGWSLFGFFFVVNFVWAAVKSMVAGGGLNSFIGDLVPLLLTAAATGVFMSSDLGAQIKSSIDVIGTAVTGESTKSIPDLINGAGYNAFVAITNVFSIPAAMMGSFGWTKIITMLVQILMSIIPVVVTVFLLLIAMMIYIGVLVTSQISVTIALVFAPILVPFLMFKPADFLFDGWLRFLIGASLMKIIGLLMNQFTGAILGKMASIATDAHNAGAYGIDGSTGLGIDIVLLGSMILLAGLAAVMMLQVPSITSGLLSGSSAGGGFGGLGHLARMSGVRATEGAGKKSANAWNNLRNGDSILKGNSGGRSAGAPAATAPQQPFVGPSRPPTGYRSMQKAGGTVAKARSALQTGFNKGAAGGKP